MLPSLVNFAVGGLAPIVAAPVAANKLTVEAVVEDTLIAVVVRARAVRAVAVHREAALAVRTDRPAILAAIAQPRHDENRLVGPDLADAEGFGPIAHQTARHPYRARARAPESDVIWRAAPQALSS